VLLGTETPAQVALFLLGLARLELVLQERQVRGVTPILHLIVRVGLAAQHLLVVVVVVVARRRRGLRLFLIQARAAAVLVVLPLPGHKRDRGEAVDLVAI